MRKRLIGKAFAVAMTGAMAFTATPVTANIFNVAHVKLLKLIRLKNGHIVMLDLLGQNIGHMRIFIMLVMLLAQMF